MDMFLIVLLIFLGLLFLVAELVLLPGVSIGGVLALLCCGSSIYIAVRDYGVVAAVIVAVVIVLLSAVVTVISLRTKTWHRFSLRQKVVSSSMVNPADENVKIGDRGVSLSRLAPMGKVEIGGRIFEAKSLGTYVDPKTPVEVVGFENFNVIVKITE